MSSSHNAPLDAAFDKILQFSFPPVMVQLLQALLEPSPSFASISSYLSMDPMLAGRVLHIVNSVSFGFNTKVTNLQRAAIAIGTTELFKLVVTLSLQQKLNPVVYREPALIYGDWRLTLWSALSAEAIASKLDPDRAQDAYLAGMLKDMPLYLAFCHEDTPPFLCMPRLATLPWPGRAADELTIWGRTHEEMTRDIFLYWGFPDDLAEAVGNHHGYAGVSSHNGLTKSLILATRWAELLHGPETDPEAIVSFELKLAAELDLDMDGMEKFRSLCAEKFGQLLGQLGIQQGKAEARLYSQSLSGIQNYYFLALGVVNESAYLTPQSFARSLARQLHLFWDIEDWDLNITLPGTEVARSFGCISGIVKDLDGDGGHGKTEQIVYPIANGESHFGFVRLTAQEADVGRESLPLFFHMLGMHLASIERKTRSDTSQAEFENLPFVLARQDSNGTLIRATTCFLDSLGLDALPNGMTTRELLHVRLGLTLPPVVHGQKKSSGWFVTLPDEETPGTPVYLSLCPAPDNPQETYLLLGDVTRMSPLQILSLTKTGLLDALLSALHVNICLVNQLGLVVWADGHTISLSGRNIFEVFIPEIVPSGGWKPAFLRDVQGIITIRASRADEAHGRCYELVFSSMHGDTDKHTLLVIRPV